MEEKEKENQINESPNLNVAQIPNPNPKTKKEILLQPSIIDNFFTPETYDEHIFFYHPHSTLQSFEIDSPSILESLTQRPPQLSPTPIPFLTTTEFLYSKSSSIFNDRNMLYTDLPKDSLISIIRSRITQFLSNPDPNFKIYFIGTLKSYCNVLPLNDIKTILFPALYNSLESFNWKITDLLIKKLSALAHEFNSKGEEEYSIIKEEIVPLLFKIFNPEFTDDPDIKRSLFKVIVSISHETKREELSIIILSNILKVSNENEFTNAQRKEITMLLIKIIKMQIDDYGKDYCEKVIIPQVQMLCGEKDVDIKKEVCEILPNISKEISLQCHINKLRGLLEIFCTDGNFELRKSAISVLPFLMKDNREKSHFAEKNTFYISLFTKLMLDHNKSVRLSALGALGKFIVLLELNELDKKYLDFYKNSIDEYYFYHNSARNNINDEDRKIIFLSSCNFSYVLFRYGKDNWKTLKEVFLRLSSDNSFEVSKSIISSYSEICTLLGSDITKTELMPLYDLYLTHPNLNIRRHAVNSLLSIICNLDNEVKKKYIDFIKSECVIDVDKDEYKEMREREEKGEESAKNEIVFHSYRDKIKSSEHIEKYFSQFNDDVIMDKFVPLEIMLCCDDVSLVRSKCGSILGKILVYMYNKKKDDVVMIIQAFANATKFRLRLVAIDILKMLLQEKKFFSEFGVGILTNFVFDKVIDVRIKLIKFTGNVTNNKIVELNYILKEEKFGVIIDLLLSDNTLEKYYEFISKKVIEEHREISEEAKGILEDKKYIEPSDEGMKAIEEKYGVCCGLEKEKEKEKEKENANEDMLFNI